MNDKFIIDLDLIKKSFKSFEKKKIKEFVRTSADSLGEKILLLKIIKQETDSNLQQGSKS